MALTSWTNLEFFELKPNFSLVLLNINFSLNILTWLLLLSKIKFCNVQFTVAIVYSIMMCLTLCLCCNASKAFRSKEEVRMLTFVCACRLFLTETTLDPCIKFLINYLSHFCVCLRVATVLTPLSHQWQDVVLF